MNPVTHVGRRPREPQTARRSEEALAEAATPKAGREDRRAARPLFRHHLARAGDKARLDWWRKQFDKLSIQLERDRLEPLPGKDPQGHAQVYGLGWHADYPDPENFLSCCTARRRAPTAARTARTTRAPSSTRSSSA